MNMCSKYFIYLGMGYKFYVLMENLWLWKYQKNTKYSYNKEKDKVLCFKSF
jgi:hypothetical protein